MKQESFLPKYFQGWNESILAVNFFIFLYFKVHQFWGYIRGRSNPLWRISSLALGPSLKALEFFGKRNNPSASSVAPDSASNSICETVPRQVSGSWLPFANHNTHIVPRELVFRVPLTVGRGSRSNHQDGRGKKGKSREGGSACLQKRKNKKRGRDEAEAVMIR